MSGAITRIASQPRMVPKVMQASEPPVTAQSTAPERTMWKASPIACVAEAQALATDESRSAQPAMHRDLARRRIDHQLAGW